MVVSSVVCFMPGVQNQDSNVFVCYHRTSPQIVIHAFFGDGQFSMSCLLWAITYFGLQTVISLGNRPVSYLLPRALSCSYSIFTA